MFRRAICQRLIPAAAALLMTSVPAKAQNATTLKRIAEALDGFPGSGPVFVVLGPEQVAGIVRSRREADSLVTALPNSRAYGPYEADLPNPRDFVSKCFHWQSAMSGYCPNIQFRDIMEISVNFRMRNGQVHTVQMPRGADALFLSSSAFDKFAFPYYARVYGPDSAAAIRRSAMTPQ